MDFRFTEEQAMIRDTARAFLTEVSHSAAVRSAMVGDSESWSRIVQEMGWQALTVPEHCDGLGLGFVELAVVQEAAGEALLVGPLHGTLGAGVSMLRVCADDTQQKTWLPAVAAGEETLAVGIQRSGGSWRARDVDLRYRKVDGGYVLAGEVAYVVDGDKADTLLVVALDANEPSPESARVFRIVGAAPGVERKVCRTLDQTRPLATISMLDVSVEENALLTRSEAGWPAIAPALDLATIALAAELLGVSQRSLDMTVSYTMEREQFGRPVAGFQALKHKAADMMLRSECARSAVYYAACTADAFLSAEATRGDLAEAASIAKASSGDAAFLNAGEALQMHGGVGFTWEYDVHLYFKRGRAGRAMYGSSEWHRERLAAMLLDDLGEAVA